MKRKIRLGINIAAFALLLVASFPIVLWAIRSMLAGDYGAVWRNDLFRPNNPLKQIYPAEVLCVFLVALAVAILWVVKTVRKVSQNISNH